MIAAPPAIVNRAVDAARRLRKLACLTNVATDVDRLVAAQGGLKLTRARLRGDGRFISFPRAVIEVNERQTEVRQRFTICHELGHTLFVNPTDQQRLGFRVNAHCEGMPFELEERLCNLTAAELLLPDDTFSVQVSTFAAGMHAVRELAEMFKVSRLSVLLRLIQLKPRSWTCAVVRWQVVPSALPYPAFQIRQVTALGGFVSEALRPGWISRADGLCRAAKTFLLSSDEWQSLRFENCCFRTNAANQDVWSIVTQRGLSKELFND